MAPPAQTVTYLVRRLRDDRPDLPAAQMAADRAGRVGTVGQDHRGAGPARANLRHPDTCHHRLGGGCVTGLARGAGQGQGARMAVCSQMDLGAQSTAGRPSAWSAGSFRYAAPLPFSWPRNGVPGLRVRYDFRPLSIMVEKVVSPGREALADR